MENLTAQDLMREFRLFYDGDLWGLGIMSRTVQIHQHLIDGTLLLILETKSKSEAADELSTLKAFGLTVTLQEGQP